MNHKAIVLKQLSDEIARTREHLATLEAGVKALNGNAKAAIPVVQKRRTRVRKTQKATAAAKPAQTAPVEDSAALQAKLAAISARTDLTPIQKAQESRKVRLAMRKVTEGAVLAEAG